MEACDNRHEHHDLFELKWSSLVTHSLADRARELLGICDLHPFWCAESGANPGHGMSVAACRVKA